MHGLGDTPSGWASLERQLPALLRSESREPAEKLLFRFPAAPKAPVTISNGAVQTSWFDLFGACAVQVCVCVCAKAVQPCALRWDFGVVPCIYLLRFAFPAVRLPWARTLLLLCPRLANRHRRKGRP